MEFIAKNYYLGEFICELTNELDKLAGFTELDKSWRFHYVLLGKYVRKNVIPIRIPGGTVGAITVDDDKKIVKISIATDYVVDTYPSDINEIMKKYIGTKLDF